MQIYIYIHISIIKSYFIILMCIFSYYYYLKCNCSKFDFLLKCGSNRISSVFAAIGG